MQSLDIVFAYPGDGNLEALLQIVKSHIHFPIFPNLRTLSISVLQCPADLEILDCLVSPSISSLYITFHPEDDDNNEDEDEDEGEELEDLIPMSTSGAQLLRFARQLHLRHFLCHASAPLVDEALSLSREISVVIDTQPQLEVLELANFEGLLAGPLTTSATLKNLTSAAFITPAGTLTSHQPSELLTEQHSFPNLHGLLAYVTTEEVPFLLSAITSPHLSGLDIAVARSQDPQAPAELSPILDEVQRFENLTSICLHFLGVLVPWRTLEPLLACTRVKIVELDGDGLSTTIGDEKIQLMAQAWPHLRELYIRDFKRYPRRMAVHDPPAVSLQALVSLTRHCPLLKTLSIAINASTIPVDVPVGYAMRRVGFPCSVVDANEVAVAEFIVGIWPYLQHDRSAYSRDPYVGSEGPISRAMGDRWEMIWKFVGQLQRNERIGERRGFMQEWAARVSQRKCILQ